jgi:negative regulator of sigma E activity
MSRPPIPPTGSGSLDPDDTVLSAYLDGECTDAERVALDARLADSADLRAVLAEVAAARDAVRGLPLRDAPPGFFERLLAEGLPEAPAAGPMETLAPDPGPAPAPVDLAARRARRTRRWTVVGGAAAAAMIAVVVVVPRPASVTPPVATFTDAHAVRSSLQDDVVSSLVPLGVRAGFRP